MKVSFYDAYVLTHWAPYSGTRAYSEDIYTVKDEADQACLEANNTRKVLRQKPNVIVQRLDNFLSDLRDDARAEGERNAADNS